MAKRQRMGWWFLCLACVVVIVCTAQRMAGLHALQMNTAATAVVASAQTDTDDASPVAPCELSAKSLLASPPVLFTTTTHWRLYAVYTPSETLSRRRNRT